jgi:ankyrin repeat protein
MKFLLEKGASESINKVMYQDSRDEYLQNMYSGIGTPLQLAASKGLLDLVKLLVEQGADPLIKDPRGKIAIDRAVYGGHTDVVEFLHPLSILDPSNPRHDFVDGPGLHFKPMPMGEFLKKGQWKAIFYP